MPFYIFVSENRFSIESVMMHLFHTLVFPYNNKQHTSKHVGTEIGTFCSDPAVNKTAIGLISRIEN